MLLSLTLGSKKRRYVFCLKRVRTWVLVYDSSFCFDLRPLRITIQTDKFTRDPRPPTVYLQPGFYQGVTMNSNARHRKSDKYQHSSWAD